MKVLLLTVLSVLSLVPSGGGSVSVAYAGSLVRVMEGPVANTLLVRTGLHFAGEGKGSTALAHLISADLRSPDVFITADPSLLAPMERGATPLVSSAATFGSARMVVAYSQNSPNRLQFAQVAQGKRTLLSVLADPRISVGRTDPQLDPKGVRTIEVLTLLGSHDRNPALARAVLAKASMFPEEDLAVRVESGEVDAGFFYSTEIPGRGLVPIELPPGTNLSGQIAYALAIMRAAPHPQAARTFADFVLNGPGKPILEQAGVSYFAQPRLVRIP